MKYTQCHISVVNPSWCIP